MSDQAARATIMETRGGGMVSVVITAHDRETLDGARDRYLARWHPLGYGTDFADPAEQDGVWRVAGSRMTSCD
jgi:hypothetical protein